MEGHTHTTLFMCFSRVSRKRQGHGCVSILRQRLKFPSPHMTHVQIALYVLKWRVVKTELTLAVYSSPEAQTSVSAYGTCTKNADCAL